MLYIRTIWSAKHSKNKYLLVSLYVCIMIIHAKQSDPARFR